VLYFVHCKGNATSPLITHIVHCSLKISTIEEENFAYRGYGEVEM